MNLQVLIPLKYIFLIWYYKSVEMWLFVCIIVALMATAGGRNDTHKVCLPTSQSFCSCHSELSYAFFLFLFSTFPSPSAFHHLNFLLIRILPSDSEILSTLHQEITLLVKLKVCLLNVKGATKTCLTEDSNISPESSFFERPPRTKCSHLHRKTICTNKKLSSWVETPFGPIHIHFVFVYS